MSDTRTIFLEPAVLRTRALLAVAYLLGRFIPIPILDDLVRERIGREVVTRAAAAASTTLDAEETAALGAQPWSCMGCLGMLFWFPFALIFFPVRLFLGVRFAGRDLVEIFALGRTLDRVLRDGRYPLTASPEARRAFAREARTAFDRARMGLDLHAVQGLLSVALGPVRAIAPAAMRVLRKSWHGDAPPSTIDAPADRLAHALDDPRMKSLFETIDRRFDEEMEKLRARGTDR